MQIFWNMYSRLKKRRPDSRRQDSRRPDSRRPDISVAMNSSPSNREDVSFNELGDHSVPSDMVSGDRLRDSVVHKSSGLQETGHILEEGQYVYNITLNKCDIINNVNSYHILQVIKDENDGGDAYHVLDKWDDVGKNQTARHNLEKMAKSEAIKRFEGLFLVYTGRVWKTWVTSKEKYEKQPESKHFPLDLDYKAAEPQQEVDYGCWGANTTVAPRMVDLMKMLFDPKIYWTTMRQLDITMPIMPLGKLRLSNIEKGFEVLTELEDIIKLNEDDPLKELKLSDASSHFFTLIPSERPHVIGDETRLKAKVEMLETLRDIAIASQLIRFENTNYDPFHANYKKLQCVIQPLSYESKDYKIIKQYLEYTHADTHDRWELKVEDAYEIDRKSEDITYIRHSKDINRNRMLLWHGSPTTNILRILNQGLQKAPTAAPKTGYMFGKGIYFADMGSKSAQYCKTTKENPTGFMLLCEVALGQIHELTRGEYMDKPPKGKDSTKGVGMTMPREDEYTKLREVTVPCGHPVPSGVEGSQLKYNEYVVYDNAQVRLKYLVKVGFSYKN